MQTTSDIDTWPADRRPPAHLVAELHKPGTSHPNPLKIIANANGCVDPPRPPVRGGNVVRNLFGAILDGCEPLPRYLLPELLFGSLERIGWIAVAESDVLGVARISLTDTGRERYEQLLGLRQPAPCRVLLN